MSGNGSRRTHRCTTVDPRDKTVKTAKIPRSFTTTATYYGRCYTQRARHRRKPMDRVRTVPPAADCVGPVSDNGGGGGARPTRAIIITAIKVIVRRHGGRGGGDADRLVAIFLSGPIPSVRTRNSKNPILPLTCGTAPIGGGSWSRKRDRVQKERLLLVFVSE